MTQNTVFQYVKNNFLLSQKKLVFFTILNLPILYTFLYIPNDVFFIKLIHQIMGQFEPTLKILPFLLDVIFQLFWHINGSCDTKYQMSICDDGIKGT